MALTKDRNTLYRDGVDFLFPVAAAARIYAGAIVALNADGYTVPGTASTGLAAVVPKNKGIFVLQWRNKFAQIANGIAQSCWPGLPYFCGRLHTHTHGTKVEHGVLDRT